MKSMKEDKWKNKALYGQYPRVLEKPSPPTNGYQVIGKEKQRGYW